MLLRSIFILLLIPFFSFTIEARQKTRLQWKVSSHNKINEIPKKWVDADVPGAVQLDIAKSENYGPYYFAENWKDYLWMED